MQMCLHTYGERGKEHDTEVDCIDVHNLSKLQVTSCDKNIYFGICYSFVESLKTAKRVSTCFTLPVL